MHILAAVVALSPAFAFAQSSFSVYSNASDIYPLPSSPECADALASVVECPPVILNALPSSFMALSNLTTTDLSTLCTSACYNSLINITETVDSFCGGWPFILQDTSYIASLPFRYLAYQWNRTCLVDTSASEYCLTEEQASESTTDQSITSLPSAQLCTTCNLDGLNVQMTSPFGWDGTFVSDWESIQSTCNFAANNTIPASLLFNASNPLAANGTTSNVTAMPTLPPASSANCTFGSYTVQSGDTCDSIAAAKSLSYDQLISINGLDINCTMLPPAGSTICLSGACSLYTVQTNDTCVEIAADHNVTWSQLLSWNPQINSYCNNLILEVGKGICVGPPGGGYTPSATVTFVTGSPTAIAIPTAPIAPGADRSQCGQWYVAVPGDTCPEIITVFQLTNETFYELNPLVNADCSNLLAGFSYCVAVYGNLTTTTEFVAPTSTGAAMIQYLSGYFPVGTGYLTDAVNLTSVSVALPPTTPGSPIPTPTPTVAPGSLNSSSCFSYYEVQTGDSCLSIEVVYDITEDELMEWNPEIASNCSNLVPGLSYCVLGPAIITTISVTTTYTWPSNSTATTTGTTTSGNSVPTNVASGTNTTGCTQYYTVQSGDSCSVIEQDYSITLAQFLAWNPEVFANCTNIDVGLAYCVSGPAVSSSPTTTSSTPTASPTAPGTIPTGCTQYYTVVSGDNCGSVDAKFNITLAQFLAWNTGVDSSCDNLELGYQYCVAGPPLSTTTTATPTSSSPAASPTAPGVISGCTEYYTVVSGDYCSEIETKFNITSAEFLAWNTDLNSDCSNLEAGYEYCVAGPSTK